MIKVLFICHGNICRSPMAEFVFKDLVIKNGLGSEYKIFSAATHDDEIGSDIYPEAASCLDRHGIHHTRRHARRVTKADYDEFDFIIGMDSANMKDLARVFGGDPDGKVFSLMSLTGSSRSVADPWYTRDFEQAYRDIAGGCNALLAKTKQA